MDLREDYLFLLAKENNYFIKLMFIEKQPQIYNKYFDLIFIKFPILFPIIYGLFLLKGKGKFIVPLKNFRKKNDAINYIKKSIK